MNDRIPCINPTCRRTAPRDKHEDDDEIVCGKFWQLLPKRLTERYKALRKRERKLLRLLEGKIARQEIDVAHFERVQTAFWNHRRRNWNDIRSYFLKPQSPQGLESFLKEIGME